MFRVFGQRSLVLVLFGFLVACGGGGGGNETPQATADGSTQYTLDNGGKIVFSADALTSGTTVDIQPVPLPDLGDQLTPVGRAYQVDLSTPAAQPVEVSLPIPDGEDPDSLVIVRLEDNGFASMLQTQVENNQLVALTPGFSKVLAARLEQLDGLNPLIVGPDTIPNDTSVLYSEQVFLAEIPGLQPRWKVYELDEGMNAILSRDPDPLNQGLVFINSANSGRLRLEVQFYEPETSFNVVAYKDIRVRPYLDADESLDVAVIGPNFVERGELLELAGQVLNTNIGSVDVGDISSWRWTLDGNSDCGGGQCTTQSIALYTNDLNFGTHTFELTVQTDEGLTGTATLNVEVLGNSIEIITTTQTPEEGEIVWNEILNPNPEINLGVQITGGVPPYTYTWRVDPEIASVVHQTGLDTHDITFNVSQPGGYRYYLNITDSAQNRKRIYPKLDVKGALPFTFSIDDMPNEVNANEAFTATLELRGHSVVNNGFERNVREYWVDWGDGSTPNFGELNALTTEDAVSETLAHRYTTPGEYTIKYYALPYDIEIGINEWINNLVDGGGNLDKLPQKTITVLTEPTAPALDSTITFYADGSAVPTPADYSQDLNVELSSSLWIQTQVLCAEMANSEDSYSSPCVYITANGPGQNQGNEVYLEMRLSHLLQPGEYSFHSDQHIGEYARLTVGTEDLEYPDWGSTRYTDATINLTAFGINPGDHITGTIDANLQGGIVENGLGYGRYQASFDIVIPADQ
jgi:hypothetical protein